jgi:hypothetical protein
MLSDYSIQGAAIVNKSCLGNETLEITDSNFKNFPGGIRLCLWIASHACRSLHLGSYGGASLFLGRGLVVVFLTRCGGYYYVLSLIL